MNPKDNESDYQLSHIGKGKDYDEAIYAGDFNTYMAAVEDKLIQREIPKLYPDKIPRYLDFACGTGRITKSVEKLADTSIAVDVSETMLNVAKMKCESTHFLQQDIVRENPQIEPINLITAFRFFGNAQDSLRNSVLSKMSELIVENGHLIINNHRNPYSLHELLLRCKGDFPETDLSYWKLKAMLHSHGFKIKKTIGIGLWACTYSLRGSSNINATKLRKLESISRFPLFGPFCPDAIIIAQKI